MLDERPNRSARTVVYLNEAAVSQLPVGFQAREDLGRFEEAADAFESSGDD
jgi:hypothetical protein